MNFATLKNKLNLLFLVLMVLVLTAGCGGENSQVDISGSTTVQPLAEKLAIVYMEKYPGTEIVVTGGGSGTGIRSVANGIVDIGTSSRELMENEARVLTEYRIALDGITFIVHPSLGITSLTMQQAADIFTGKISNWKEVNGPDMKIDVVTREAGSGTRDTIETKVIKSGIMINTALQEPSNGAVRTVVTGMPSSIGYISIAYIDSSVKALEMDGVKPSFENVNNGTWPLMRPLLLLTRGAAKGKAKDFIDFCLSPEGQEIVTSEIYAGVE